MREEPLKGNTAETSSFGEVLTKQQRIAELAKQHPEQALTNLHHYIDENWLRVAFEWTRKDGATGIDGQTAQDYERDLAENLKRLLYQIKSGRYVAPAVRRVHIPKGNGKTRPIGIPTVQVHYTFIQQQFGIGPNYSSLPSTEGAEFPCSQKSALWRQRDSDFAELSGWQFCSALGVDGSAGASTRGIAHRSTGSR
jgi:hypothetical protein